MLRRLKVLALTIASFVGFSAFIAALIAYLLLTNALPRRDGGVAMRGLDSKVEIELDERAIPRIRGDKLTDVFRAQGFMHAQERFFQMDLTRRQAAGELSALFGQRAGQVDQEQRVFEFRRRAAELLDRLPELHRTWVEAYTEGVNAGLDDLGARPPEYWPLRAQPVAWSAEDSLLVVFAIYTMLSNNENYEAPQAVLEATLPAEVYAFLTPSASRYDRPVLADATDPTGGYRPAAIPEASVYNLRELPPLALPRSIVDPPLMGEAASNQWVSDASRNLSGHAMLANDPHLGLRLPNLFYRAELYWPGHAVRGVSIPGLPGILIGANEHIAWGAAVSYADQSDWVALDLDPSNPNRYRANGEWESITFSHHDIETAGGSERIAIPTSRWGPITERDGLDRPLALKATWLEPDGLNLAILELNMADSTEAALAIIERWSGPSLSWVVASSEGSIGWAMNGPLPQRIGFDGSSPQSWADGTRGWQGYVQPPSKVGSDRGVLFQANNRALPLDVAGQIGRMWVRPLRAYRIEEMLAAKERFVESDFLKMQLDTRAVAYEPIRDLLLEVVPADEPTRALSEARKLAANWNGRADADQAGFRLLHAYYLNLLERVLAPLLQPAITADPNFVYRWPLADEPLLRLLEERPPHLLANGFADWPRFFRAVLNDTLVRIADESEFKLETPWGEVNRLDVAHPLASLPVIGRWLRLPAHPQPGSAVTVRVASPGRGAVFRLAVAPANPSAGILQMAGGQSGHFLSPNFVDLHDDWAWDQPTPFLAGPTATTITLQPIEP